jgi:lipopolysaccharide export system protein LptA
VLNEQVRGKGNQQMEAHGRVLVRAREFQATADHMNYNEAKDQIIFEAEPGNTAYLAKNVGKGVPPQKFTGRKIIYSRSTGNVWGTDGESLSEGN